MNRTELETRLAKLSEESFDETVLGFLKYAVESGYCMRNVTEMARTLLAFKGIESQSPKLKDVPV